MIGMVEQGIGWRRWEWKGQYRGEKFRVKLVVPQESIANIDEMEFPNFGTAEELKCCQRKLWHF